MKSVELEVQLEELIQHYFSDPEKRLRLGEGETLMVHNTFNNRLFLVLEGSLRGIVPGPAGIQIELFRAGPHMFVGIYSFFSLTYRSSSTVVAEEDSLVAYIDSSQPPRDIRGTKTMSEQFMPFVVSELVQRTQKALAMAIEKEQTMRKLIQTEKMASLGQMAAGIAHELNNAITVLGRNTEWIKKVLEKHFAFYTPEQRPFFSLGLLQGRRLSTREIRKRKEEIVKRFAIPLKIAGKIAQSGVTDETLQCLPPPLKDSGESLAAAWETGATLHDMLLASHHAKHVVGSVKTLGTSISKRTHGLDINESIKKTLSLMGSGLRPINVSLELAPLPAITANEGELVQIWTNLIKNAIESLRNAGTQKPAIRINSSLKGDRVCVSIEDNGPGISPDLLHVVFQPNVTTKTDGLSFGLGLGLTIVESLLSNCGGTISLESAPGKTIFTVCLPKG